MKKIYSLSVLFLTMNLLVHGQTITLQPDATAGKDAQVLSFYPTMNFGTSQDFDAGMWTSGGVWWTVRSLVQFDLSGIPANSVINSATLSLYFNPNNTSFTNVQYGPNSAYVQRVTGSWLESTVTWATQPAATVQNQAILAASTSSTQDYPNIDVTALVTDMKNNPSFSNGFLLKMQTETNTYRGLIFASSDYTDPNKRPKLVITYSACTPPAAAITAGGPTTFCAPGSVTLNATPTGAAYSYQWVKDGINISGATSNSYVANVFGSYTCVVKTIATGCSKASNAIAVTVNTVPSTTITAGGPTVFCTGGSVTLSATTGAGFTYQWKLNGSNISGATLSNYNATANGSYTCFITNNCGSVTSSAITVMVYSTIPAANITAGGPTTFCSNSNVLLSSTNTGVGISHQWQKNSVNISGAVFINYTANQTGSYRCVVTNPCGSSNSNAISVTANTQPIAAITPSGVVNICTGASKLLTASAGTGYIYQWKKNGADITGATSQTYTTSLAGSYAVVVTSGTCTATSAATTVTVNQALTPTITDNGLGWFCGSTAVVLGTQTGSGFIYQWFEDSHPVPDANSSTLNIGHNGTFSVQINNGCGIFLSSPYTETLFGNPWLDPYITIVNSGSLNLCAGGSVNLFINSNTFFFSPTFEWYKDGVPVGSGTSYNATTGGNYACSVYDFYWGCGSQGPTVFSNWLVVTSAPSATITPQGSTTICSGQSVVLSANAGGGFVYQWKKNGTNISGATNQNYTANAAGSYSVVVINTCSTATSTAVAVTVNALPSATITPAGSTTFCMGDMLVLNAPTGANKTYQWLKGGNNISGATASSYSASTGGNYKVTVTNSVTGCSKTTANSTVLTTNPQPSATVTPQGPTTFCAGSSVVLKGNSGTGLTYQWKKGGNNISGATNKNYTATLASTYKLKVTNSNGCSKLSSGVTVTVPCKLSESERAFEVVVYPNPSSGDFVFELQNSNTEKVSISIYDVTGRIILSDVTFSSQFAIHNSQLTTGVYSAIIIQGENKKVVKLVKNP